MYVDLKLDIALGNRAADEGITKAELMRRFLQHGLDRPSTTEAAYIASVDSSGRPKKDAKAAKADDVKKPAKPAPAVEVPRRRVASNRR